MHDERRLLGVPPRHSGHDARAARLGLEQLRREAERGEPRLDVLGRLAFAVGTPLAVVRGVESDEIPGDHRRLVEFCGQVRWRG